MPEKMTLFAKYKRIRGKLRDMRTLRELASSIPEEMFARAAVFFLCIWCVSPLVALLGGMGMENGDSFQWAYIQGVRGVNWMLLLRQTGIAGWVLMFLALARKRLITGPAARRGLQSALRLRDPAALVSFALLLLLLWCAVSTLFSTNPQLSLTGTAYRKEGLFTCLAYAGVFMLSRIAMQAGQQRKTVSFFVGTATVLSAVTVVNSKSMNELFKLRTTDGVFFNSNHFGYYLCMAIPCACWLALTSTTRREKVGWLGAHAVLCLMLSANRSFGPWLAVFSGLTTACVVAGILLWRAGAGRRWTPLHGQAALVAVFLVCFLSLSSFHDASGRITSEFTGLSDDLANIAENNVLAAEAGSKRWPLWVNGMRFVMERPLFGYGLDNLGAEYEKMDIRQDRPHNEYLQIAASLGMPGLLLWLAALAAYAASHRSTFLKRDIPAAMSCAVIGIYLFSAMFGNTMFYTSPFFFMLMGLTMGKRGKSQIHLVK